MLYVIFSVLAAGLLVLDQWLKLWITANLPLGSSQPFLPGVVELLTVHNYGAAWSSFSGQKWLLIGLTSVLLAIVLVLLVKRVVRHPLGVAACMLIFTGGVGNLIDRVRAGYVVDMFHFEFWPSYPVFNVADICVVIGAVIGSVYYLWLYEKYDAKQPKEEITDGEADAPTE